MRGIVADRVGGVPGREEGREGGRGAKLTIKQVVEAPGEWMQVVNRVLSGMVLPLPHLAPCCLVSQLLLLYCVVDGSHSRTTGCGAQGQAGVSDGRTLEGGRLFLGGREGATGSVFCVCSE